MAYTFYISEIGLNKRKSAVCEYSFKSGLVFCIYLRLVYYTNPRIIGNCIDITGKWVYYNVINIINNIFRQEASTIRG